MRKLVLIVLLVSVSAEEQGTREEKEHSVYREAMDFVRGCGNREFSLCLKERTVRYLDNLPNNMDLGFGLKIKMSDTEEKIRESRRGPVVLPEEHRAREEALDDVILDKIKEYVRSHSLEFKMPEETFNLLNEPVEEGRKKKGGGGGLRMRPMMMLLQVKAALLGALALKFIGLVAFKALLVAKIALTISSIVALKKLVEPKHRSSTYEVVAHPHYDEHSHFDRAFNAELPYKGYGGARNIA